MPVISTVSPLGGAGLGTAGDYLRAAAAGRFELPDLVVIPVEADGEVPADAALDLLLPVPAAEVARAVQLNGKAGQLAQTAAGAGDTTVRIVLLGVGAAVIPLILGGLWKFFRNMFRKPKPDEP